MKEQIQKVHRAKKSLGQNFLKSEIALKKIIEAGEIKKEDIILEIGPGKGALTKKLLEKADKVIAIEKDEDLFIFLQEKFQKEIEKGKLVLLNSDILELEVKEFAVLSYKIIANIPYNITGAILKKFLTEENQPKMMVLMVQHEVAKRILAKDGKESILSISVKVYGEPKIVMKVAKRYFSPEPRVDSAIIKIANISRKLFLEKKIGEKKFWEVIHAGFAHKRKILISNLKNSIEKQDLKHIFEKLKLKEKVRAEELTLSDWLALTSQIK